MKLKSAILLLLTVFCLSACNRESVNKSDTSEAFKREYAKIANITPEPRPPELNIPTKRVYKKTEIGMDFTDFSNLCMSSKGVASEDNWSTLESANGTIDRITRAYSQNRAKNDCWGTFTFVDGTLDSIYRN